jgi:hypothetical protein
MYHEFLGSASFWLYLRAVDEDLAAKTRDGNRDGDGNRDTET